MVMFLLSLVKGSKSAEGGKNLLADMDRGSISAICMVMFLLSLVKGSKSAEGGKNLLADMDPGGGGGVFKTRNGEMTE